MRLGFGRGLLLAYGLALYAVQLLRRLCFIEGEQYTRIQSAAGLSRLDFIGGSNDHPIKLVFKQMVRPQQIQLGTFDVKSDQDIPENKQ